MASSGGRGGRALLARRSRAPAPPPSRADGRDRGGVVGESPNSGRGENGGASRPCTGSLSFPLYPMPTRLRNVSVAILATDGFEQAELLQPKQDLEAAGATVHVVSPESGTIKGWDQDHWDQDVTVDRTLSDADAADYAALVLPGGQINPDKLRIDGDALDFVKAFASARQADRGHLPRPVAPRRDRPRQRPPPDVLQVDPHRPQERRGDRRRRVGGPRRGRPVPAHHEPQPGRPPGLRRGGHRRARVGRRDGLAAPPSGSVRLTALRPARRLSGGAVSCPGEAAGRCHPERAERVDREATAQPRISGATTPSDWTGSRHRSAPSREILRLRATPSAQDDMEEAQAALRTARYPPTGKSMAIVPG